MIEVMDWVARELLYLSICSKWLTPLPATAKRSVISVCVHIGSFVCEDVDVSGNVHVDAYDPLPTD